MCRREWTAPVPHFFVCFLLLLLFVFFFLFLFSFFKIYLYIIFFSLKKSFLLRCVRSNARLSSWKAEFPFAFSASTFFLLFLPCGQKRLNYLTRMRRGSNNRETQKGVPSSKNNRQLVTCRPFRDSCMRTKPNSYRHGSYRLGRVYRQDSKTLFLTVSTDRGCAAIWRFPLVTWSHARVGVRHTASKCHSTKLGCRQWSLQPGACSLRNVTEGWSPAHSIKQPQLSEDNHLHVSGSLEPGACALQNVTEGWSPASNSQGWLKTTTYRHWSLEPGAGAQPLQCTRPPSTAWCIAWGTIVDRPRPRAPHYNQRSIIIVVSLLWVRKQIK